MLDEQSAKNVKSRHSARLLRIPGVSGVGIEKGTKEGFVLAVHVDPQAPAIAELPEQLEGLPVRIIKSGPFHKL